jgi:hypothetical protein
MPAFINGANRLNLDCSDMPVRRVLSNYGEILNVRRNAGVLILANRQLVCLNYLIRPNDRIEFIRVRGWKGGVPDGAPSWITEELIEETIRVWQRFYDEPLSEENALVCLLDVSELLEIVEGSEKNEEVCDIRTSQ